MAQTVVRAAQNTYDLTYAGGTRDIAENGRDITVFVDAIEVEEAEFLNSLSKGSAGDQMIERRGKHQIMPRGSVVASSVNNSSDTTISIPTGHGFRFQQMAVLEVTNSSGQTEIMWVNADPTSAALSVKRAADGGTKRAFAAGDKIKVIGHATPENADWPLAPVTSGSSFWNTYQTFSGHFEMSDFNDVSPTLEFGSGSNMARQMRDLTYSKKLELNAALLSGRRSHGSPDPADPRPRMLGGMIGYAELAGNTFTVSGGGTNPLTLEFLIETWHSLKSKYGQAHGRRALMSPATAMRVNKIAAPANYHRELQNGKLDIRWTTLTTADGDFTFASMEGLPDGKIFIYQDNNHEYASFKGKDWKEKDVPTMGDHMWRGMSGTFTYRPKHPDAYAIIDGFSMDYADYPEYFMNVNPTVIVNVPEP